MRLAWNGWIAAALNPRRSLHSIRLGVVIQNQNEKHYHLVLFRTHPAVNPESCLMAKLSCETTDSGLSGEALA